MTNLEKALEYLKNNQYGISQKAFDAANYAIEIAATPDWKYPEKGELPKNGCQIIVQTENCDFTLCAEYLFDKFVRVNTTKELVNKVIAWCELPKFVKPE